MTTQEVADKLVAHCRMGAFDAAYEELYHADIVSIEPDGAPEKEVKGIDAVLAKSKRFEAMTEAVHSNEVSDPVVADNFFSCSMKMNVTFKGAPGPIVMEEICLYQVQDGKIIKEEFFFTPMNPGA